MRKLLILSFVLVLGLGAACVPRYRSEHIKLSKARGYTEEEQLLAYHDSLRFIALEWIEATNSFRPSFKKLTWTKLREQLDQRLQDFAYILDYKSNPEWVEFIEYFKLRAEYEKKEELLKAHRDRVRAIELDNKFRQLVGQRSNSGSYGDDYGYIGGYNQPDPFDQVDLKKFYLPKDIRQAYPFESDLINEARKNGTLQVIEEFVWVSSQRYAKKEVDPAYPDDHNQYVWRPMKMALKLTSYKVINTNTEKPKDNTVDYIEGFRVLVEEGNGKKLVFHQESKPALKLFALQSQGVLVVDQDQENELGFGLPEIVLAMGRVVSAGGLMNRETLTMLFPEKPKHQRIPPAKKPEIKIEIARVGQPMDLWEKSPEASGWKVPFTYRNTKGDNFTIQVKWAKPKKEPDPDSQTYRQIEFFVKSYTGNGSVVEYLKPKAPFNEANLVKAEISAKKVRLEFSNGEEKSGTVTPGSNIFIEDRPVKVIFTEGEKRFILWDKDGNGTFELRMETAAGSDNGSQENFESESGEHAHHQPPKVRPIL